MGDEGKASSEAAPSAARGSAFAPRCVSIDLEVGVQDGRIHRFAAMRGDTGQAIAFAGGDLQRGLIRLDELAEGLAFVLGHNIVAFDLPHLAAAKPDLRLLKKQLPAFQLNFLMQWRRSPKGGPCQFLPSCLLNLLFLSLFQGK